MSKLRVALIGCGGISQSHTVAYEWLAERAEVVYCVDPNPAAAEARAATLGGQPVASYDGILGEVDAVDICTPHHLHYPAAKAALEAGCHVLVEKPLANHWAECQELIELAASRDRRLMCAYVLRYMPAMGKLKEVLAAGTYGRPIQIATSVEANVTAAALPWAAKKDQLGGGVLFSHGCHTVDLMCWLFGQPERVAMVGHNINAEWMEGEGTAQLIMEFPGGVLGHHTSSWAMPHAHAIPFLRVWLTEGFLEVAGSNLVAYVKGQPTTLYELPAGTPPAMSLQIEHYVQSCLTGQEPLTNGRASMDSLRTIWAAYRSRETRRVEEIV